MKLDPKGLAAAINELQSGVFLGTPSGEVASSIISAYLKATGTVIVPRKALKEASACICDLGAGVGGWSYEEVAGELLEIAMIEAAQEGE